MNDLKKYWQKRNFKKTPEPKGKILKTSKNRFVIHDHYALKAGHHHDFRLEMDGVLKSWAVPKGVPEEKGKRVLAIETEPHPVSYANFQGCFAFYTKVITEEGVQNIGHIVNQRKKLNVLSYNFLTNRLEWKPIENWFKNGKTNEFIRIRVPGQQGGRRIITVTPYHKIYTPEGIRLAKDLKEGDSVFIPGQKWSDEQLQILYGTLLGDAHLELPTETQIPYYQLTHSGRQKAYLEFIRNHLFPNARIVKRNESNSWHFRFTDAGLVNVYYQFYKNKQKIVTEEMLSKLDERGLAIWYMDDGYLWQKYVELCTQGFGRKGNELITKFLNEKWELQAKTYYKKPRKKNKGGYYIHLNKIGSMRFLTLVNNYILPELRYKTYIKNYKDCWRNNEKRENGLVPIRIVKIEKAEKKQYISPYRYDIHVKDNNNYFAGSILVSNSIPRGCYGAGKVKIFDKGEYELIERTEEKLVFKLKGKKIKGIYCLVKMKGKRNQYLIFKLR